MSARRPKSVTVLGHRIGISYHRDLGGDLGEFSYSSMHIKVKEAPADTMRDTLLHEILHAAWEIGGLPASGEERAVTALATALRAAMIAAPGAAVWIFRH